MAKWLVGDQNNEYILSLWRHNTMSNLFVDQQTPKRARPKSPIHVYSKSALISATARDKQSWPCIVIGLLVCMKLAWNCQKLARNPFIMHNANLSHAVTHWQYSVWSAGIMWFGNAICDISVLDMTTCNCIHVFPTLPLKHRGKHHFLNAIFEVSRHVSSNMSAKAYKLHRCFP